MRFALAMLVVLGGCALSPEGEEARTRVNAVRAAIASAEAVNADVLAAEELRRARGKMALLDRYLTSGQYKYAEWLAEQAEIDARLAEAKARNEKRRREAGLGK